MLFKILTLCFLFLYWFCGCWRVWFIYMFYITFYAYYLPYLILYGYFVSVILQILGKEQIRRKRAKIDKLEISNEQKRCKIRDLKQSWNISVESSCKIRNFTKIWDWNRPRVRPPSRKFRPSSHGPINGKANSEVNTSRKAELHYSWKFGQLVELWRELWIEFSQ